MAAVTKDQLASPEYRNQLYETHLAIRWGTAGVHHSGVVRRYAQQIGAKTILDYGCGRGTLKGAVKSIPVTQYDPGIVEYSQLPAPADLVVCTDVLEHVERDLLSNVLRHIKSLATIGSFMIVALTSAKIVLPDGTNAHKIIESDEWWLTELRKHGFLVHRTELRKGLWLWLR